MLKVQQSSSKLEPWYLLQPKVSEKQVFILITNSEKNFWMKENLSDWEEVRITERKLFRDGGTKNYYFNGKEYNKIHIPSSLHKNQPCYLSGHSESISLEKIPLSKEKLNQVGITTKIELDLSNIPETIVDTEKKQAENLKKPRTCLTNLFSGNFSNFLDDVLKEETPVLAEEAQNSDKNEVQLQH